MQVGWSQRITQAIKPKLFFVPTQFSTLTAHASYFKPLDKELWDQCTTSFKVDTMKDYLILHHDTSHHSTFWVGGF